MVRWLAGIALMAVMACGSTDGVTPTPAARSVTPTEGADQRALEVIAPSVNEPVTDPKKKVALVIGNSAYETAGELGNPRNDARDLTVALLELGFEVVEGYDLDATQMQQTLREFSQKVDGASVALFFYAGHGVQVDGRNYMLPVDAHLDSKDDLEFEAVDMNKVLVQLERQPRINVIILDACRNNPLADNLARAFRGSSRSVAGSGGGLAALDAVAPGTLISFSTQPGATASDGAGRNSPYTSALLKYLRTPGLEVQAMMRRVGAEVVKQSQGAQVPWQNASLTTDFYFRPPKDGATAQQVAMEDATNRAEFELWVDVKDSGSVDELQAYVEKFPQGTFVEVARSRIKGLQLQAESGGAGSADLQALFARLSKRGVLVEEPEKPHEFYNNARMYEERSDSLNASKMYARYIEFGLPYLDPHLSYQTHLKAQEGREGAREAYNELAYDHADDPMLAYAAALLQPRDKRVERLTQLAAQHPEIGPLYYDLSMDFSLRRLGEQTLGDKRAEKEALDQFFSAIEAGNVYKYFLDKRVVQERIEEAESRKAALTGLFSHSIENPVTFTTMRSNAGWTVTAIITDLGYQDILVAKPGEDFVSLGTLPGVNPMTGKPNPKPFVNLPGDVGATTLRFKYLDARGEMQGPFEFAFEPDQSLLEQQRTTLQYSDPSTWLVLQHNPGRDGDALLYLTHILTSRCAISGLRYGLDRDTPDTSYEIPACDKSNPYAVPRDAPIYLDVPDDTQFVSFQITWFDGTKTKVERTNLKR